MPSLVRHEALVTFTKKLKLPLGWRCCRMRTRWHDKAKLSHLKRDDWRDNFFLLAGENLFRKWFFNLTRWLSVTWDQKTKKWNLKGHLFIRQQFLKSAFHRESKAFFILPHVYNLNVFKQFLSKKINEPYRSSKDTNKRIQYDFFHWTPL